MNKHETIAFVGEGRMGANMARRLHKQKFSVKAVYDVHRPVAQARDGTLYLMCAGREKVFHWAEPILQAMGKTVCHVGATGKAAQVKALVNMVMNTNTAGLAEGRRGLGRTGQKRRC